MSIILYDVCYDERLHVYRDKLDIRLLIFYNVCNKEYGMKGEISKLIKKDEYISLQSMWRCDVGLSSIFPPLTGVLYLFQVTSTGKAGGAGVRAGCAVKAINGTPTAQLTLSHAHALTKQGSTLTLEIDE